MYVDAFCKTLEAHGGKALVGAKDIEVIEGAWKPRSLVILSFPSKAGFGSWYRSTEYGPLLELRLMHASASFVVAESAY